MQKKRGESSERISPGDLTLSKSTMATTFGSVNLSSSSKGVPIKRKRYLLVCIRDIPQFDMCNQLRQKGPYSQNFTFKQASFH
ncbi:hypothetical protein M513_04033 [Trichuris suis]|uniref:Uncharacterized protein n=1 Tax=Trichuris suis TaxID=68888 RepID=A0A085MD19_9BILA|nr:hypothetical protein M513_04033 [Trichuris suis]